MKPTLRPVGSGLRAGGGAGLRLVAARSYASERSGLVEPTPRREYWVHWYSIWLKNTTDLGICPPLKEPESKGWSYRFYLDSGYAIDANHPENRFDRSTGSEDGFYKGSDNRLAFSTSTF